MSATNFMPFLKRSEKSSDDISSIKEKFPMELGVLINRYVDPFLGRGSMLFEVMSIQGMSEALVSDIDGELINTYKQVKNHTDDLLDELQILENKFIERTYEEKADFYKSILFRYRHLCHSDRTDTDIPKAAMYIFLDAASYITHMAGNGYMVTTGGTEIILPKQIMKLSRVCDERTIRICAKLLQNVQIRRCDFRECLGFVDDKTLLYLDPPPVTEKKETAYPFTEKDIQSVLSIDKIARSLGAEVILSQKVHSKQK